MSNRLIHWLPEANPADLHDLSKRPAVEEAVLSVLRYSPVYRNWLQRFPGLLGWLNDGCRPDGQPFGHGRYAQNYQLFHHRVPFTEHRLQAFRRLHSLRILLRQFLQITPMESLLREISDLADFCLQQVWEEVLQQYLRRFGQPWDETENRPASCIVIGLGKLGGRELNFYSDADLLFCFSGFGFTRRGERSTRLRNREFFHKVASAFCQQVQQTTPSGQLYRVDLRLRPDGDQGPLVPSLDGMMRYYFERGQTWERLTLLKARRIAGPRELAHEWQEILQSFRYPRHAPPQLADDVVLLKTRTEAEGRRSANRTTDIKNGWGGIRELEFFTQTLQLIHGARFPFLQTPSTMEALRQLGRYAWIGADELNPLLEAYAFLRQLENLLQARQESSLHHLPQDASALRELAQCCGLPDVPALHKALHQNRLRIHRHFRDLFPRQAQDPLDEDWLALFSDKQVGPRLQPLLQQWFGQEHDKGEQALRRLATDRPGRPVSRQELSLFSRLAPAFSDAMGRCADPVRTVRRTAAFAETYASRRQFLQTCQQYPHFLRLLALLFDRSSHVFEILRRQPAIMEELLTRAGRRRLDTAAQRKAISHGPAKDFPSWLRLYLHAEWVRILGNELLEIDSPQQTEAQLTALAEAACQSLLQWFSPDSPLVLLAMGKFGTGELVPGSDMDVLAVCQGPVPAKAAALVQKLTRSLSSSPFPLDLRLRPHGKDGALVISIDRMEQYYRSTAMDWERQLLTRARPFAGPPETQQQFTQLREDILFNDPRLRPPENQPLEDPNLRRHRLATKLPANRPWADLKQAPGGLLDLELKISLLCRRFGHRCPELRQPASARLLPSLHQCGALPENQADAFDRNYRFLRQLQYCLRRDRCAPVDQLPEEPDDLRRLARWNQCADAAELTRQVRSTLAENLRWLS